MAADASTATQVNPTRRVKTGRVKDLKAGQHGPNEPIFHALVEQSLDMEVFTEDFDWTTITASAGPFLAGSSHQFTYAESNAGATDPAKLAPTRVKTSAMTLATTAVATYAQSVILGSKKYFADAFPFVELGLWVSQVTDFSMVIGFADAIAASAGDIVSDIDTPAVATVADGAFYAIDTAQTLKTAALVCVGTSTAVSKTVVSPTAAPFGVPTAATFIRIRVQLEGNGQVLGPSTARLFVNDALVAENFGGPDSEKLLVPVFFHKTPGGTALVTDIDYVKVGQMKPGAPL